jgi:hypothetical protein
MDRMSQLRKELDTMPAVQNFRNINRFKVCIYVFETNANVLLEYLNKILSATFNAEQFFSSESTLENDAHNEIARLLHNFFSSAFTLIDNSYSFYDRFYKYSGNFQDYKLEITKRFENNALCCFVKDLRHFIQHVQIPTVSIFRHFDEQNGGRYEIKIKKSELLLFKEWSNPSKEFLNQLKDSLDIYDLVNNYKTSIINFYEWVQKRLDNIHAQDRVAIKEKRKEYYFEELRYLPLYIDAGIRMYKEDDNRKPEQIFQSFTPKNVYEKILMYFLDPVERMTALTNFWETITPEPLPLNLKNELIQISKDYKGTL